MTWRRLHQCLLIGSTVMLAVTWLLSFRHHAGVSLATRPFVLSASVYPGTLHVSLDLRADHTSTCEAEFTFDRYPAGDCGPAPGRWLWDCFPIRQTGRRDYFLMQGGPEPPFDVKNIMNYRYLMEVPLWVPWAAFIMCACTFRKLMERQSVAGNEKELAEGEVNAA